MSQRVSGYERKERDLYETPEWVTQSLVSHIPHRVKEVWEPACASGKMVRVLERNGFCVDGTDLEGGLDFLACCSTGHFDAIITNPPYELATDFIKHALSLMEPWQGVVAMLLRTDFDHAKTRTNLFADNPSFAKKVVLTKRIKWFEDSKGQPSFNHAWFIWDWLHKGPPTLSYEPLH